MKIRYKALLISTILLLFLDFLFILHSAESFQLMVIRIQRVVLELRYSALVLCYIALIFGLNYFIIQPKRSVTDAFILGLFTYFIYEITNYATLKKWSPIFVIKDTLWGGIYFALTTYITYQLE